MDKISKFLLIAMCLSFACVDAYATTAGLNTVQGQQELPLAVQGNTGIDVVDPTLTAPLQQVTGTPQNVIMPGKAAIGTTTFAPSSALTVNGNVTAPTVTVSLIATLNTNCSNYAIATLAQDGTGKLLSCQSGNPPTWQLALAPSGGGSYVVETIAIGTTPECAATTFGPTEITDNCITANTQTGLCTCPTGYVPVMGPVKQLGMNGTPMTMLDTPSYKKTGYWQRFSGRLRPTLAGCDSVAAPNPRGTQKIACVPG